MLDDDSTTTSTETSSDTDPGAGTAAGVVTAAPPPRRRRAASRPAGPPAEPPADIPPDPVSDQPPADETPVDEPPAKRAAAKRSRRTSTAKKAAAQDPEPQPEAAGDSAAVTKAPARKRTAKKASAKPSELFSAADDDPDSDPDAGRGEQPTAPSAAHVPDVPLFQPPDRASAPPDRADAADSEQDGSGTEDRDGAGDGEDETGDASSSRRRRRRGGRRRRKAGEPDPDSASSPEPDSSPEPTSGDQPTSDPPSDAKRGRRPKTGKTGKTAESGADPDVEPGTDAGAGDDAEGAESSGSTSRRRRRRRRQGEAPDPGDDDPDNTVVKVRERKKAERQITGVEGSTRLEAKKQRRREGREVGRRRPPILSESEFLARRESVTRNMVVRQRGDMTQIAVLEDNVLVEHYVARESQTSLIGNVYLGRVQNVLPSMEAAFIDIGKGRNAVLYAGEVDWKVLGMDGKPRKIEDALSSGQHLTVQVTKDPIGNKGARLTSQVSLPGRFLVYVPAGHTSGISRKLPEPERARLKGLLKDVLPEDAGVIIRTAAEGATEEQLIRDVHALTARWDDITKGAKKKGQGPKLLYGEPDLLLKVVRDLFTEDFASLVVQGDDAWNDIEGYVAHVAPDLAGRCERHDSETDVFAAYRVDEQIDKALDRKVFLPSGGSLVIDRTEAMTVVDVNTGKFTGSGGNLEETVTKNNLEAAEEMVRQLRLRDIGGIIVVDFIDMVLESNRDLVLRRVIECLSRDRTRHQVAEVTSLGLVQLTRKKIGTGLLEAFSEPCGTCDGRGVLVRSEPVMGSDGSDGDGGRGGGRRRAGRQRGDKPVGESADTGADEADPGVGDATVLEPPKPRPPRKRATRPAAPPTPTDGPPDEPADRPAAQSGGEPADAPANAPASEPVTAGA